MKNLGLNYAKPLNFPPRCKKSFVTFLLNLKNVNHLFLCILWEFLNRIFRHSDPCLIEESIKIAAWTTLNQTKQCFEIFFFSRKTKTTRFFVGGLNFPMLSHKVFHSNKFALVLPFVYVNASFGIITLFVSVLSIHTFQFTRKEKLQTQIRAI